MADRPASSEPRPEVRDCPLMHGAAPCPMCAYCPHGLTAGRGADERCLECGAAVTEPRPENPYRMDADSAAADSPLAPVFDEGVAAVLAALESSEAVRAAAKALTSPFNPNPREMEDEARAVLSAVVVHLRGGTDPPAQA